MALYIKQSLPFIILFFVSIAVAHPIKMSTARLEIEDGKAQVTMNVFWDDFSAHLIKTYRNQIKPDDTDKLSKKIISDYVKRNFRIENGKNTIPILVQDFTLTEDNVLQIRFIPFSVKNISYLNIHYSVLMDGYEKQTNILHVMVSGERKTVSFSQGNELKSLVLD